MSVNSDTSVQIVGVYNKGVSPTNFVDLNSSPFNAVRAQEPKPYPSGYVSEPPEVTDSIWDTAVNWSFQTNALVADWIWETERAEGPANYSGNDPLYDDAAYTHGRVVKFQKTFTINGIPQSGTLFITADNAYEVWINSNHIARSGTAFVSGWELTDLHQASVDTTNWQNVGQYAISAGDLVNGSNTITILAGNEYFWSDDGNSPSPALNLDPYYQYNPGALIFSLDVNYDPILPLEVTKTANTSFARSWDWTINKTVSPTAVTLAAGEQFGVYYSVLVNAIKTDSNWAVNGNISIHNPNAVAAEITGITDILGTVVCPGDFTDLAGILAADTTLNCTYSGSLQDDSSTSNTVTVATSGDVPGGSGDTVVTFGTTPTSEIDECVVVTDTLAGTLGNLCAGSAPHTYSYIRGVGPYSTPGTHYVDNIATVTTNNTVTQDTDDARVTINVPVAGCTLTQGYWKNHSQLDKAPYDDNWANLGSSQEQTLFFFSGDTWLGVFRTAPKGNAYYQLAHQYMAAELNILNGATSTSAVDAALVSAKAFFGTYTPANFDLLGKKDPKRSEVIGLAGVLGSYNEGSIGPGHCDEQNDVLTLTGQWSLNVNNGAYMHDMYIVIQNPDGSFSGHGGYVAGTGPIYGYPYNWTVTGQLTGSNITMTITYQSGYTATISGTVNATFDSMSGGAGTGGVNSWSATRI